MATDQQGLKALSNEISDVPLETGKHLILIPNKTRGLPRGRWFLLKGGQVEKIKIIEGPYKGREDWIQTRHLHPLFGLP